MTPYENTFIAKGGMINTVRVNLSGEVAAMGIVDVRTIPSGATVLAGGDPVGVPTPTSFKLPVGQHTLRLTTVLPPSFCRFHPATAGLLTKQPLAGPGSLHLPRH